MTKKLLFILGLVVILLASCAKNHGKDEKVNILYHENGNLKSITITNPDYQRETKLEFDTSGTLIELEDSSKAYEHKQEIKFYRYGGVMSLRNLLFLKNETRYNQRYSFDKELFIIDSASFFAIISPLKNFTNGEPDLFAVKYLSSYNNQDGKMFLVDSISEDLHHFVVMPGNEVEIPVYSNNYRNITFNQTQFQGIMFYSYMDSTMDGFYKFYYNFSKND